MKARFPKRAFALLAALAALGVLAGVAVSLVSAGGGTLTGGGSSNWDIGNTGGTSNGLPAGGSCDGSPGLTVGDADIPAGSDAYDNGQMIWVDGAVFAAPGPVSPVGQTLTAGPVAMSGLDVTMEYYAATGTATSRTFVTFTNPGGSPINTTVDFVTNVGSDSGTMLETTSSGDATFTTADRWAITSDGAPFGDPVNTHVLFGPGSPPEPPSSVSQTVFDCSATDGIMGTFDITVPAGGTRALMFFNQMNEDDTGAISGATAFDTNPPVGGDLLSGLSTTQLGEALNWDFGLAPPTATPPAPTSTSPPPTAGITPGAPTATPGGPTATVAVSALPATGATNGGSGEAFGWLVVAIALSAALAATGFAALRMRARRT